MRQEINERRRDDFRIRDVLEEFSEAFNPRVYPNYSNARWQKYMDIKRWSRINLYLKQRFAG
jgi:hypothetical protein